MPLPGSLVEKHRFMCFFFCCCFSFPFTEDWKASDCKAEGLHYVSWLDPVFLVPDVWWAGLILDRCQLRGPEGLHLVIAWNAPASTSEKVWFIFYYFLFIKNRGINYGLTESTTSQPKVVTGHSMSTFGRFEKQNLPLCPAYSFFLDPEWANLNEPFFSFPFLFSNIFLLLTVQFPTRSKYLFICSPVGLL